jgi:hypothetical protein
MVFPIPTKIINQLRLPQKFTGTHSLHGVPDRKEFAMSKITSDKKGTLPSLKARYERSLMNKSLPLTRGFRL